MKPRSSEFRITIRQDFYFNALQVKYAYALTCHKAQGGEWDTVVVNFSDSRGKNNEEFFRWAYTAITRAKRALLTINAPRFDATTSIKWGDVSAKQTITKPIVETGFPPSDQDWNRFSFNCGQEELFAHHKALRDVWTAIGITIDHLDHLQYCERYLLSRGGKRAAVQYQYKKNLKVSTVAAVQGTVSDSELLSECLSLTKKILLNAAVCSPTYMDPFLAEFRDRVESSLAGSDICLVFVEPMPYRLRFEFKQGNRRAQIDFIYNSRKKWSQSEEVGGPGSSKGIIDRVRKLLEHNT